VTTERLCVNPHMTIKQAAGSDLSFTLQVHKANERLYHHTVSETNAEFPAILRLFEGLRSGRPRVPKEDVPILRRLGLVVESSSVVVKPNFQNPIARAHDVETVRGGATKDVRLAGRIVEESEAEASEEFLNVLDVGKRVWHVRPRYGSAVPWWPDAIMAGHIETLRKFGKARLPAEDASVLVDAGIVMDGRPESEVGEHERFEERKWVDVGAFSISLVANVARYFRALMSAGFVDFDEPHARFFIYNDPVGSHLNRAVAPLVSKLIGRSTKPTYSYLSSYTDQSALGFHRDHELSEYTMNLLLDYRPVSSAAERWPLVIQRDGVTTELKKGVGGSLLFCGRLLEHGRPRLQAGHECDVLLLHFVDDHDTVGTSGSLLQKR